MIVISFILAIIIGSFVGMWVSLLYAMFADWLERKKHD